MHGLVRADGEILQRLQHQWRGVGREHELGRSDRRHAPQQREPKPPVQIAIAGGLIAFEEFRHAETVALVEDSQREIQIRLAGRPPQVVAPRRDHGSPAAKPKLLLPVFDEGVDVFARQFQRLRQLQQTALVENKQTGFFRANPCAALRVHQQ